MAAHGDDRSGDHLLASRSRVEGTAVAAYRGLIDEAVEFDHLDEVDALLRFGDRLLANLTTSTLAHTLAYFAIRTSRDQRAGGGLGGGSGVPGEP